MRFGARGPRGRPGREDPEVLGAVPAGPLESGAVAARPEAVHSGGRVEVAFRAAFEVGVAAFVAQAGRDVAAAQVLAVAVGVDQDLVLAGDAAGQEVVHGAGEAERGGVVGEQVVPGVAEGAQLLGDVRVEPVDAAADADAGLARAVVGDRPEQQRAAHYLLSVQGSGVPGTFVTLLCGRVRLLVSRTTFQPLARVTL